MCIDGNSEDILLSGYILQIPYFNFEKYVQLSKSRISILSNNCWGGVVYKTIVCSNGIIDIWRKIKEL